MSPQLAAMFAAHKTAILGAAAAGVAGLALLRKKKTAGAAATSSTIPGTLPAAAVVAPSAGGAYDSSSYDLYNALQPEIEQLLQTQGAGVSAAPEPVASSIFAPTGSGQLVRYDSGRIGEVESDGSLFGLTPDQFTALASKGQTFTQLPGQEPKVYTTAGNLAAKNPAS